jgi:glycosyltransferase involved in cell wall biosynthesis
MSRTMTAVADPPLAPAADELAISVVIPVRNAAAFIEECLASVLRSRPAEVIVVDGCSTDATAEIVARAGVRMISDGGAGVAAARMMGVEAGGQPLVALIDADVVVPDGVLAGLLDEFRGGGYSGLQAGLHSVSGPGYWGRALASHHNLGRSRNWFGLMATIVDRDTLLAHPLDSRFASGEDIDARWRLAAAGLRIGVSRANVVTHRFGDTYEFARDQWRADGAGLARMVTRHRHGGWLLFLPAAAAARGVAVTTVHLKPQYVPYYVGYAVFNYAAMFRTLWGLARSRSPRRGTA